NSSLVGRRQSQWPVKQPLVSNPSGDVPPFNPARKAVKASPSGAVPLSLQEKVLSASCGSDGLGPPSRVGPPSRLSFFSHINPVLWSVTVPSRLSTKRTPLNRQSFNALSMAVVSSPTLTLKSPSKSPRHCADDGVVLATIPAPSAASRMICSFMVCLSDRSSSVLVCVRIQDHQRRRRVHHNSAAGASRSQR